MKGQVIAGRYRLVHVLGKGGMGAVWLAEHLSLHTLIAIKIIDSEVARNPGSRGRFEREARLVACVRSTHVVKVLDHGVTAAGLPFIAMEYLAGESLRQRLNARGRLTGAETARIVSHVCRGLSRAHEAGLVHRDLKPGNVFLAQEDDGEVAKILDFGVAKAPDILALPGADPTRTGALLGTPSYMSPEQAQGLKSVDFRTDLWAMGILVFECLTGRRPFSAPALGPLIALIVAASPPSLREAVPEANLPPEVDTWLRKALSRDPAGRFASARDLADAFLSAVGSVDSTDRDVSLSPPKAPLGLGGGDTDSVVDPSLAETSPLFAENSPEAFLSTEVLEAAALPNRRSAAQSAQSAQSSQSAQSASSAQAADAPPPSETLLDLARGAVWRRPPRIITSPPPAPQACPPTPSLAAHPYTNTDPDTKVTPVLRRKPDRRLATVLCVLAALLLAAAVVALLRFG